MPLTDAKLRNLKPREKPFKASDGQGLYVLVSTTGARLWRLNYKLEGKQKTLALGAYPQMSLLQARMARDHAKAQLTKGVDPTAAKRAPVPAEGDTFEMLAERWFIRHRGRVEASTFMRDYAKVKRDVFPALGAMVASTITPKDVVGVIRKIEARGAVAAARRIRGKVSQIFRFGVAEGILTHDPARDIDEALAPRSRQQRLPWLPAEELPGLFGRVRSEAPPEVALAILLAMLTAQRTRPILRAEWGEIEDLDGPEPVWRTPADKMKVKGVGDHVTPLSQQAVAILKAAKAQMPGRGLIFHLKGKPLHNGAMITRLYDMGLQGQASVHGFRHGFSTWANEAGFNGDHVERCLAHVPKGVRGRYNAAEWLPQRRELLQAWADYVEPRQPFGDLL